MTSQLPLPWAVCLCAAWCRTCEGYRAVFDEQAGLHPDWRFEWLDVEDEAAVLGDLDIETFPTLLLADAQGQARFFGPLPPQEGILARLLAGLETEAMPLKGDEAQALFERIARHVRA